MKMNLGMKIGAGFGALVLIACLLGGLAILRMQYVASYSTMLDQEYVPEVDVAVEIERAALETMYAIRGYGFTEQTNHLLEGREKLAEVGEGLQKAQELADRAPNLVQLPEHIRTIRTGLSQYTKLLDDTVAVNDRMRNNRAAMNNAAQLFVDSLDTYLTAQTARLEAQINNREAQAQLLERLSKITEGNNALDLGNDIRIAAWRAQAQRNPDIIRGAMTNFEGITGVIEKIRPITIDAQDLRLLDQIQTAANSYRENTTALVANWLQAEELGQQRGQAGYQVVGAAHSMAEAGIDATIRIADESITALNNATWVLIIGLLIALVIGVVIAFFITRSITVPIGKTVTMLQEMGKGRIESRLKMERNDEIGTMAKTMDEFADTLQNQVVDSLQKLAQGDLTFTAKPYDDRDVIGNALVKTNEDLNRIVGEILAATEQIAAGSGQVSSSSQSLSQGATESAASLEEITSSMTEMASQTKLNAENSTQANQLAGEARKAAETGNDQMEKMMIAMGEINQAGQNISKIIKVIDEIAFQTNLLALNAAVEAARAGRHGKGFAVVAEEVRNLAARSAKAAKETAELIEGSVAKTENGTEIAAQTAESLQAIVTAITKATDLVGEIAAASNEQAQGISQVNEGLSQIDQVTQTNTANAEEGAAAAEELSSQADHLRGLMATFTVKGGSQMTQSRRQKALPAAPAQHKPASQEFKGWDQADGTNGRKTKPSEVIALDDREFGRY